jgi:hypothetical protein
MLGLSPLDMIVGFGPILLFLLCFLVEALFFPVGVFVFVVSPPFLYLFSRLVVEFYCLLMAPLLELQILHQ